MSKKLELLKLKYMDSKVVDCGKFMLMYIQTGPLVKLLVKEMVLYVYNAAATNKNFKRVYGVSSPLPKILFCLRNIKFIFKVFYYKESGDMYITLFNIEGYPSIYLNKGYLFDKLKALGEV